LTVDVALPPGGVKFNSSTKQEPNMRHAFKRLKIHSKKHTISRIEPLEQRRLYSGWTTVSSDPTQNEVISMAADRSGNVYALDDWNGTIRKSSDAGATWTTIAKAPASTTYNSLAVDTTGDLFVAAQGVGADGKAGHGQILEMPTGQSSLTPIDDVPNGNTTSLTVDTAGDIFAIGQVTVITTTTSHGKTTTTSATSQTIRERLAGQSVFSNAQISSTMSFNGLSAIDSGASAGVYVAGETNGSWSVLKSTNLGQSWSIVDQYQIPTASGAKVDNQAWAVAGDPFGNVYVTGQSLKATVTGTTKKGAPVYSYAEHWIIRQSSNGGASWSTTDYQLDPAHDAYAGAIGTDLAGNVYVVGGANDASNLSHAIVRTNAGGTWHTVDDYTNNTTSYDTYYFSFAADSNGNLYAGGQVSADWFIRSTKGPTATALLG
jgi:hypothetical protein